MKYNKDRNFCICGHDTDDEGCTVHEVKNGMIVPRAKYANKSQTTKIGTTIEEPVMKLSNCCKSPVEHHTLPPSDHFVTCTKCKRDCTPIEEPTEEKFVVAKANCPGCETEFTFEVPAEKIGKQIFCPDCKGVQPRPVLSKLVSPKDTCEEEKGGWEDKLAIEVASILDIDYGDSRNKKEWKDEVTKSAVSILSRIVRSELATAREEEREKIETFIKENWRTHLGGNAIISADELLEFLLAFKTN